MAGYISSNTTSPNSSKFSGSQKSPSTNSLSSPQSWEFPGLFRSVQLAPSLIIGTVPITNREQILWRDTAEDVRVTRLTDLPYMVHLAAGDGPTRQLFPSSDMGCESCF